MLQRKTGALGTRPVSDSGDTREREIVEHDRNRARVVILMSPTPVLLIRGHEAEDKQADPESR